MPSCRAWPRRRRELPCRRPGCRGRLWQRAGTERRDVHRQPRRADRRPRPQRRRQDDALSRSPPRAAPITRHAHHDRPLRQRPPDRALPPRLPRQRARRRTDGDDPRSRVVAAPDPHRPRRRARRAEARRPRRPRRAHVRRAVGRAAPACADRASARAERAGPAARRAVHRPRHDECRPPGGAAARARPRRPSRHDRHARPRAGASLGSRPVRQRPPDRVRGPSRDAHARRARADVRRRDRDASRRGPGRAAPRDPAAASPPPRTTALMPALATVLDTLADPFSQALMQRALLEVLLLAVVGGTLGCWIVLGELSYGAESLAHGMFPGLVLAALAGIPLLLGGAAGILVAALAVALAGRVPAIGRDNATAVAVTTLFGLGALLALSPDAPLGIQGLLFGDVLGTTTGDLLAGGALVAAVLLALWAGHWRLLAVGFDRDGSRALGVAPLAVDGLLLTLIAMAVLVAVQGLGNLIVVAVLVAPAAAARLLTRRLAPMMAIAVVLGMVAGIGGLYLSYYASVAAGASIAGLLVAGYLLARLAAATSSIRKGRTAPAG